MEKSESPLSKTYFENSPILHTAKGGGGGMGRVGMVGFLRLHWPGSPLSLFHCESSSRENSWGQ